MVVFFLNQQNRMQTQISNTLPANTQALIIAVAQSDGLKDQMKQIADAYGLSATFIESEFAAKHKEVLPLVAASAKVYLVGLGKDPKMADCIAAMRSFAYRFKGKLPDNTVLNLNYLPQPTLAEGLLNGFFLGDYEVGIYKTDIAEANDFFAKDTAQLTVLVEQQALQKTTELCTRARAMADTQQQVMQLGNAPANHKTPKMLGEWASRSGQKYGFDVKVFDQDTCKNIGLEALLAVGAGSRNEPVFIVMEYKHPDATEKIGLVGKGVTFDTGGISIKQSANMHLMKSDMGGAAAVFGALEMAAKLQLPVHLIGIVPSCENSVDGLATKPSEVMGSYSGKTIEMIDTDAEGRLILADGLAYLVRNYSPDVMIDLATLTGSCVATLGYAAAGMFTNNADLSAELYSAGQLAGEKLWPLPLWEDYQYMLKSDVADLKNYSGLPVAGAISAAKFLEVFTENHPAWAHLDIAGTAFTDSEFASMKSASGFGVRLLVDWIAGRR